MTGDPAWVRRTGHALRADPSRVAALLFLPGQEAPARGRSRSAGVLDRVMALSDREVDDELAAVTAAFGHRHRDLVATWDAHFALVAHRLAEPGSASGARRRLIGAYFTQEFAIEAAGLLNPSMVAHPDQSRLPAGSTRFVMTARGIGEGHISSIELRTGTVDRDAVVTLDPEPAFVVLPDTVAPRYSRPAFAHRIRDDVARQDSEAAADAAFVLAALPAVFDGAQLAAALGGLHAQHLTRGSTGRTADRFAGIAASTYEVAFPATSDVAERVLMPRAPCESHGMEDVRMVRFCGSDGGVEYLGTYTAYDGRAIATHLLRTTDFRVFTVTPLSGPGAGNKGLALFPRKIGGRYMALSRADRESNALTTSTDLTRWSEPVRLQAPRRPWEVVQVGNGGPPIETERGWLVLTHGVGPMRTYGIGALLLDLERPDRVVARLEQPLLTPAEDERSGYVPNVVYTCGAMLHGRDVVVPYGCSDSQIRIALVGLDPLLDALCSPRTGQPRSSTSETR